MKIDSSAVALTSNRTYMQEEQTSTVITRTQTPVSQPQDTAPAALNNADEFIATASEPAEDLKSFEEIKSLMEESNLQRLRQSLGKDGMDLSRLDIDNELSLIEQILNAIDAMRGEKPRFKAASRRAAENSMANLRDFSAKMENIAGRMQGAVSQAANPAASYSVSQTTTYVEVEATEFSAQGIALTEDGREITFNVDVSLTRAFMEQSNISVEFGGALVDPLVINIGNNVASVRDQKFTFDIDADGTADEISRLGPGSGFLALDKNGDGVINDGSELFGAKTGDGFSELAVYDEDGNGWIDENDSVFNNLKVWTQDEDGSDRLVAIAQADVGAIYLGSVGTDFSLTDDANNTNAVIRRSGVYLKESGGVGTVQHVDFSL